MMGGGKDRRRSLLFDATEFTELTAREIPSPQIVQPPKLTYSSSFTMKRTGSTAVKVLSAFSKLPPEDKWLRSGVVERQTMSSDTLWLPRLMILTEDDIIFAKEGTDLVLDQFALKYVTFIGKVRAVAPAFDARERLHASITQLLLPSNNSIFQLLTMPSAPPPGRPRAGRPRRKLHRPQR
jgi:hypothetical protein